MFWGFTRQTLNHTRLVSDLSAPLHVANLSRGETVALCSDRVLLRGDCHMFLWLRLRCAIIIFLIVVVLLLIAILWRWLKHLLLLCHNLLLFLFESCSIGLRLCFCWLLFLIIVILFLLLFHLFCSSKLGTNVLSRLQIIKSLLLITEWLEVMVSQEFFYDHDQLLE